MRRVEGLEARGRAAPLPGGLGGAGKDELKAALDRSLPASSIRSTGNRQTQEALMRAVAREECHRRGVGDRCQGADIVYYGRHKPPLRHVDELPSPHLAAPTGWTGIPEEPAPAHAADRRPADLGGHRRVLHTLKFGARGPREPWGPHPGSGPTFRLPSEAPGLFDGALSNRIHACPSKLRPAEGRPDRRRGLSTHCRSLRPVVGENRTAEVAGEHQPLRLFLSSLIAFWISIPSWMLPGRPQARGERAGVWGLFGLLGNVMALVVYLLVRRDDEESG